MISTVNFDEADELLDFIGDCEISQDDNVNAYTRLFINGDTVSKLYVGNYELAQKNITNIRLIFDISSLKEQKALTLPKQLISFRNKTIGYTMPFVSGLCLEKALESDRYPMQEKIDWFRQLADLIRRLPLNVHVGDLHGRNVIVSKDGIKLIDMDGFSLDDGYEMSFPILPDWAVQRKYCDQDGKGYVSRNSDILFLFLLFFSFIFRGADYFALPEKMRVCFLEYLVSERVSESFLRAVKALSEERENFLEEDTFCFSPKACRIFTYEEFLKKTGLYAEEDHAKRQLDEYIKSNHEKEDF